MTRDEIIARARYLLDQHGLQSWSLKLDHARRRAGACIESQKTITLSGALLPDYPSEQVDTVILHEVAHALVGAKHGHNQKWRDQATALGIPAKATLAADLPRPVPPWVGTCPRCGSQRKLYRAPRRVTSCGSCSKTFRPELLLSWSFHGTPTVPPGAYAKELRRIRLPA